MNNLLEKPTLRKWNKKSPPDNLADASVYYSNHYKNWVLRVRRMGKCYDVFWKLYASPNEAEEILYRRFTVITQYASTRSLNSSYITTNFIVRL